MPSARLLALAAFARCVARGPVVDATRHTFYAKDDARILIGPIGAPFGFLTGGIYNLTVFDFELSAVHKKKKKHGDDGGGDDRYEALQHVEAGFLLKRFASESDFSTFWETVMEEPDLCSFESYREEASDDENLANEEDDALGLDDALDVDYGEEEGGGGVSASDERSTGRDGVYLSMNLPHESWKPRTPSVSHRFESADDEGLYFLMYQICPHSKNEKSRKGLEIRSSFALDLHFKNYDSFGNPSYLTSGEMALPGMFLYFSVSYALCLFIWAMNIRSIRLGRGPTFGRQPQRGGSSPPLVYAIHHLMTVLLALKTTTVFTEAARYHYIRLYGHAEAWSVVYFAMSFLKGIFLFTVILLIGSGWSFVKPFLNSREKKVIWAVLVLQIIDNVAVVVLTHETEGERLYDKWAAVLHLVDILCCCAVLVPIVWQVNSLEKSVEHASRDAGAERRGDGGGGDDDGQTGCAPSTIIGDVESESPGAPEAARTLRKLKLFRSFYLLVVAYIYFTRIVVYLFATMLGYRHTWLRYFVTELGTLAFYAVVGFQFRPMAENPYLEVKGGDDRDVDTDFASLDGEQSQKTRNGSEVEITKV